MADLVPTWWELTLGALAVFRLWRLLAEDEILEVPRRKLLRYEGWNEGDDLPDGGFSDYGHGFEDWSAWAKCFRVGAQIVQVPEAVYVAYINPQSQHRVRWRNRSEQIQEHLRVQAELFPEGV